MKLSKWLLLSFLAFVAQTSLAGSFVNTYGSADDVAISGYDTVAFFTEKKAIDGKAEFANEWQGAKWMFASQENMNLFIANPERYAPQYGGHCAFGASEGYISKKRTSGQFEVVGGKLYLFPEGSNGDTNGARTAWFQTGGGASRRIYFGDQNWPKLKAKLEGK